METEKNSSTQENKNQLNAGILIGSMIFVGCLFIGAGLGSLYHKTYIGSQIGMGTGFILMGAIIAYYSKKNRGKKH